MVIFKTRFLVIPLSFPLLLFISLFLLLFLLQASLSQVAFPLPDPPLLFLLLINNRLDLGKFIPVFKLEKYLILLIPGCAGICACVSFLIDVDMVMVVVVGDTLSGVWLYVLEIEDIGYHS
jgi:hypothetical protein